MTTALRLKRRVALVPALRASTALRGIRLAADAASRNYVRQPPNGIGELSHMYRPSVVKQIFRDMLEGKEDMRLQDILSLSPPKMGGDSDAIARHLKRMIELGWLRRTNEMHHRNHPDMATLRISPDGERFARAALDEPRWRDVESKVERLLNGG